MARAPEIGFREFIEQRKGLRAGGRDGEGVAYGYASDKATRKNFDAMKLFGKSVPAGTYPLWKGTADQVQAGFDADVVVTVPKGQASSVKAEIERVQPLVAPIVQGQRIGTLRVRLGERVLAERPVLALAGVEQAGLLGRAWDTIRLWMNK